MLAAAEIAQELGLPAKMRLVGYAFKGVEPEVMGYGPIPATEQALKRTGLSIGDIGVFEINEESPGWKEAVNALTMYCGDRMTVG